MIASILKRLNANVKTLEKKAKAVVAPLQPLQVNTLKHLRNKPAEAILRRLQRQENQPAKGVNPRFPHLSERSVGAAGVTSHANREVHAGNQIKIGNRVVHQGEGHTTHDLSFGRDSLDPDGSLVPRRNITPTKAKLRQANIKYQNGVLLNEVKQGDQVTATPIPERGKNARASMYDRMTNGALASHREGSFAEIDTRKDKGNLWTNIKGQQRPFNPEDLKKPLKDLAKGAIVKRLMGHPLAQAALLVDDVVGQATGTKPTEKVGEEFRKTVSKSIEERLKKGKRTYLPAPLPF